MLEILYSIVLPPSWTRTTSLTRQIPGQEQECPALTEFIEDGYEEGLITGAAVVDLSAAYDTVNHRILTRTFVEITQEADPEHAIKSRFLWTSSASAAVGADRRITISPVAEAHIWGEV